MSRDQRDERGDLLVAADLLERLAARTTGGEWSTGGLLATRPEVVSEADDGRSQHVADARASTADWITTLSPALAPSLVAWLRSAAAAEPPNLPALAFAGALLDRLNARRR